MTDLSVYSAEAINIRRKLHRRPEEGWTEFETMWEVVPRLEKLGFMVQCGLQVVDPKHALGRNEQLVKQAQKRALEHGVPSSFLDRLQGYTGAVATLDTGHPGPVTAFRFDMDCVQITESTDKSHLPACLGFGSERPGLMHACGHDAHTASGLALAHWIADHKDLLCGRFKLIFQPAEEGTRGGAAMAAAGVVDDVTYFFGAHVGVYCQSGEVGIIRQGLLATTKIDVHFEGTPAHAGANPEKGRSALSAACACTLMLEGITRHSEGMTRVAVGKLNAGEGRNITPVHADMQIEVRGQTADINDWMVSRVNSIVSGAAEAYEVKGSWRKTGEAIPITSDKAAMDFIDAAAHQNKQKLVYLDGVWGSEDCSLLIRRAQQHGAKAAFFVWGCTQQGHHRPDFDVQDTVNMPHALAMLSSIVMEVNGRQHPTEN